MEWNGQENWFLSADRNRHLCSSKENIKTETTIDESRKKRNTAYDAVSV